MKYVPHIHYAENTKGRDFVIGDLHGEMRQLEKACEYVDFDPSSDRIFSVGDLIDRGEDSIGCLRLTDEDWLGGDVVVHQHAFGRMSLALANSPPEPDSPE